MTRSNVLFLTDRGMQHQQWAREAAPDVLNLMIYRKPDVTTLQQVLPEIDFIISERAEPVTSTMITAALRLKLIVRLGSLAIGIDENAARARHIPIRVLPVAGSIMCAEHAVMMLLAAARKLGRNLDAINHPPTIPSARTDEDTFRFNWNSYTDLTGLYGKRIGIVGMGEIGVEAARRLRGFGLEALLYHKRTPYPADIESALGITYAALDHIAATCDAVVVLLPYAPETDQQIGASFFTAMKPGALLIHLGSGSTIDEHALLAALQNGQLGGAALDTYEYEPLPADHPLITYAHAPESNLLLTPHTAALGLSATRADDFRPIMEWLADHNGTT